MSLPAPSLRALLREVIDYAGLYPPAALSMLDAVAVFATHLASREAWMLGRFVVPVARLSELAAEATRYAGGSEEPWRISVLLDAAEVGHAATIRAFNDAHVGRLVIDAAEWRAPAPGEVANAVRAMPDGITSYVELPASSEPDQRLAEIGAATTRAKLRTGGITPDAFPTASHVARFIGRCAARGVAFKATAGLHHPLRATYPLTYSDDAPRAKMFGFLNIFVASVFAHLGASERTVIDIVNEEDPGAFVFGDEALRWRQDTALIEQITASRRVLGNAFGSCSIDEPVSGLRELGVL